MNATNNIETRKIKARALGMTFNIVMNAEYDIVKRCNGWGITKNGEFINAGKIVLYAAMGQPDERTEELTGHKAVKLELNH